MHIIHLPIYFRVDSLALGISFSCFSVNEEITKNTKKVCLSTYHNKTAMWELCTKLLKCVIFDTLAYVTNSPLTSEHDNDVIMGPIASQITSLTIVYSTVYSDADQSKHQRTGEVPAQMASNAENVSIWWRHHGPMNEIGKCQEKCFHLLIFNLSDS